MRDKIEEKKKQPRSIKKNRNSVQKKYIKTKS